jgi:hypothetical protein
MKQASCEREMGCSTLRLVSRAETDRTLAMAAAPSAKAVGIPRTNARSSPDDGAALRLESPFLVHQKEARC